MVVSVGDSLPDVQLDQLVGGEIKKVSIKELFAGKKGVLFGVPGAFTPGCSKTHLPGYVADRQKLADAGAEVVVCVSVNDPFVMAAWADAHGADGKVILLADTHAELTKALGIDAEGLGQVLGGTRMRRFSAVVEDSAFKALNLEEGGGLTCSLSNQILAQLQQFWWQDQHERQQQAAQPMFDAMRRHWGF